MPRSVSDVFCSRLRPGKRVEQYIVGYHDKFPQDRLGHKLLVYLVFIFETVQTMLIAYDRYMAFVMEIGDPLAQDAIRNTWFAVPLMDSVSELPGLPVIYSLIGSTSWLHRASILCPPDLQVLAKQNHAGHNFGGRQQVFILCWIKQLTESHLVIDCASINWGGRRCNRSKSKIFLSLEYATGYGSDIGL